MTKTTGWADQFKDDPVLVALADQVQAEARAVDPRRAAALGVVLAALEPQVLPGGRVLATPAGLLRMAAEVERLAGGERR